MWPAQPSLRQQVEFWQRVWPRSFLGPLNLSLQRPIGIQDFKHYLESEYYQSVSKRYLKNRNRFRASMSGRFWLAWAISDPQLDRTSSLASASPSPEPSANCSSPPTNVCWYVLIIYSRKTGHPPFNLKMIKWVRPPKSPMAKFLLWEGHPFPGN